MILGQDWEAFCRAFTQVAGIEDIFWLRLQIGVIFGTARSDFLAVVDQDYLDKIQISLLQSFGEHTRGLKHVGIDGKLPANIIKSVKSQVIETPWLDSPKWYSNLGKQYRLAEGLLNQGNFLEASSIFIELNHSVENLKHANPPALHEEKKHALTYSSGVGIALCCIHYLETVSESFDASSYRELGQLGYRLTRLDDHWAAGQSRNGY